uniref:Jacalin-type lectin domain-containing protein n=1 Tax=Oryza barthii TaxID=65489 RepID=A0A679B9U9_9ORYZ|nr:hypothetical protein [Oryza barthii]BBF89323.1 hypothetical protein [Oryza barthii]
MVAGRCDVLPVAESSGRGGSPSPPAAAPFPLPLPLTRWWAGTALSPPLDPAGGEAAIDLGPSEYLIKVSGTTGSFCGLANLVTSLTFVTNAASYGPFGEGGGDPFVFPVQTNSSIVGFFDSNTIASNTTLREAKQQYQQMKKRGREQPINTTKLDLSPSVLDLGLPPGYP